MKSIWIVVAESARARIFSMSRVEKGLKEIDDFSHPASRLHDSELTSDLPGRTFDSHGSGRHAMEQATVPKKRESHIFAAEIARHLERGRVEGRFEALVLVAPPDVSRTATRRAERRHPRLGDSRVRQESRGSGRDDDPAQGIRFSPFVIPRVPVSPRQLGTHCESRHHSRIAEARRRSICSLRSRSGLH